MKKISPLIQITFILTVFCLFYFIYKDIRADDQLKGYYITHAYFFLILIIFLITISFLNKKIQIYSFIILYSFFLSLYFFEGYIFYAGKTKFFQSNIDHWQNGKLALQKEIKKVVGMTTLSLNEKNLISFSGISNSKTIFCNEDGFFSSYTSDRNGFNNPNNVWDENIIDVVILGDSFVHGACVNQGNDIASQVRNFTKLNTVNLGWLRTGPLKQYAAFLEYIKKEPRYIFWVYYENDIQDLKKELNNKILFKYYLNNKFSQNLINRRVEIDSYLQEKNNLFMKTPFKLEKIGRYNNFIYFIKIYKTRQIIFTSLSNLLKQDIDRDYKSKDDETIKIYFKIVDKMKNLIKNQNTKLVIVYLPTEKYEFSKRGTDLRKVKNQIFKEMNDRNIEIIDIENSIKKNFILPNVLYPKLTTGYHFNKRGYKFIASNIAKYINKNEKK